MFATTNYARKRNLSRNPAMHKRVREAAELIYQRALAMRVMPILPPMHRIEAHAITGVRGMGGTRSGGCYYITIPESVVQQDDAGRTRYLLYYVAHELAHVAQRWAGKRCGHGRDFMELLKMLCPEDAQHYELEYKPRNAAAAGITGVVREAEWEVIVTLRDATGTASFPTREVVRRVKARGRLSKQRVRRVCESAARECGLEWVNGRARRVPGETPSGC